MFQSSFSVEQMWKATSETYNLLTLSKSKKVFCHPPVRSKQNKCIVLSIAQKRERNKQLNTIKQTFWNSVSLIGEMLNYLSFKFLHVFFTKTSAVQNTRLDSSAMQCPKTAAQCTLHDTYFEPCIGATFSNIISYLRFWLQKKKIIHWRHFNVEKSVMVICDTKDV